MGKQRIIVILSMNREGKKEARSMARTVAIVGQDFEKLIQNDYFYIDKTEFSWPGKLSLGQIADKRGQCDIDYPSAPFW